MGLIGEDNITSIFEHQLDPDLRYKCLLVQSNEVSMFPDICKCVSQAAKRLGQTSAVLDANKMLDEIGAYSCNQVIDLISNASLNQILILSGPLHFLDYWPRQQRSFFWGHFACIENSAGIVMIDVVRTEEVQGIFTVIERIPHADIRYLKSRRALLEAKLNE
jgi:hypothetical protein